MENDRSSASIFNTAYTQRSLLSHSSILYLQTHSKIGISRFNWGRILLTHPVYYLTGHPLLASPASILPSLSSSAPGAPSPGRIQCWGWFRVGDQNLNTVLVLLGQWCLLLLRIWLLELFKQLQRRTFLQYPLRFSSWVCETSQQQTD